MLGLSICVKKLLYVYSQIETGEDRKSLVQKGASTKTQNRTTASNHNIHSPFYLLMLSEEIESSNYLVIYESVTIIILC